MMSNPLSFYYFKNSDAPNPFPPVFLFPRTMEMAFSVNYNHKLNKF